MRDFPLNAEDLLHMGKVDIGMQGVVAPDPADRDPPMALMGRLIITSLCGQIQGLNVVLQEKGTEKGTRKGDVAKILKYVHQSVFLHRRLS